MKTTVKSGSVLMFAATFLLAFSVSAAGWFDAGIGGYTQWPPKADAVQNGVWTNESSTVALSELAELSGTAPAATLDVDATDGSLDFRSSPLDFETDTESSVISLRVAFTPYDPAKLPVFDPKTKAGVILVKDGTTAKVHYLAKSADADANVWTASNCSVDDAKALQDVTITLKRTADALCATYEVGETVVASDVEVHAAEAKVSNVRFDGNGKLAALSGTAEMKASVLTVDAASLASGAHLEVISVRNLDSGEAVEPDGGTYSVPYGTRVAIAFRPVKGYRLAGSGVLELTATSASTVLNAATPGLVAAEEQNAFRVTPYVQHPKPDAMTLMWLAATNGAARVEVWKDGTADARILEAVEAAELSADVTGGRFTADDVLQYCRAPELDYVNSVENGDNYPGYTREKKSAGWSMPYTVPYQYRVRLTGLEADTLYRYRVTLDGDGATYENRFRTSPDPNAWRGFKFIYFSDSETEPADNPDSTGRTTDWSEPGSTDTNHDRTYFATQTECYASNLCAAVEFGTELIVMAGDLAQKGSRQCDWDEFWRHNAGQLNDPAGSIPILASPGNHDYYSYKDCGTVATRKYLSYFEYEKNGAAVDDDQQERFHRVDYGPVTFVFLDANNGDDSDKSRDTNHSISTAGGCRAPDFNPGTAQYRWLEAQLKDAQEKSAFTFIVTHQCPFSVGHHGRDTDHDTLSGQPLRVLLPLMHKYGVDGWLAGHDEMMERAVTTGTETLSDGTEVPHSFFVWDMGIAGDGLRGCKLYDGNTNEQYRADVDCPEVYENGVLVEGGKHYGHLEVTIDQDEQGNWRATFDPVYVFFNNDANGKPVYGGVRHYADKVVRVSSRRKGAAPAPQPVTKTHVDISTFVPTKLPQGLLTTFWSDACSRGFAWQTDVSVTETKLWLLKGEYDQDDGNTFVEEGALTEGTCETKTIATDKEPEDTNVHRVHVENLEPDATYSYRLGGNGHYVYGRFTVKGSSSRVTAVNLSDTQGKDATLLYKAEKTAALAARTAGDKVDLVVCGGDLVDSGALKNANHVRYGETVPSSAKSWEGMYWKWGLMTEILAPHFQGVPWFMAPGNHDYKHYRDMTAVDYYKTGMSYAGCSSVDIGNVHFVELPFLGTYKGSGVIAEYAAAFTWLDADLKASSARWKVVSVHWGPYTTGDHGAGRVDGDNTAEGVCDMVRALTPILSRNHVDLVLQAHDHVFSKSVPYRWDTDGYTSSVTDEEVLNLSPATLRFGGEWWDANPAGTYYVSAGCAGPRAAEEPDYPTADGSKSYTRRDPKIVMGKVVVDSKYRSVGDEATGDFHDKSAAGVQMFGILKVNGDRLSYDFYVAEEDGTVTLIDKLRVMKGDTRSGCVLMLK